MCTVEAFSRVLQSVSSTSESLWLWLWYKAYRRYHRCPAELTVLTVLTVLRVERREIVHFCSPPKSSVIFLSFCFPSCLYSASETDSSAGSCLNHSGRSLWAKLCIVCDQWLYIQSVVWFCVLWVWEWVVTWCCCCSASPQFCPVEVRNSTAVPQIFFSAKSNGESNDWVESHEPAGEAEERACSVSHVSRRWTCTRFRPERTKCWLESVQPANPQNQFVFNGHERHCWVTSFQLFTIQFLHYLWF